MRFGVIPVEGGRFYRESLHQVERAEALGFHSVWIEEHHGVKSHYWPSPLTVLSGYATRAHRLVLGTNIAVLPLYNPVRIAEDAALLDIISGGRFILGVAIGYRTEEFKMMSAPTAKRGARLAEAVTIIRRLWSEDDVSCEGEFFRLEHVTLEPKPLTRPGPAIWIGGWGPLSLKRAAELGDAWIPGPTAGLDTLKACQKTYHQHLRAAGKDPSEMESPLTRDLVIAATDEEAWRLAQEHVLPVYRDEYGGGWDHPIIGKGDPVNATTFKEFARNRFIIGSPESCVRQAQVFREALGSDHLILRLSFPGLPHDFVLKELELLGREVLPAFA